MESELSQSKPTPMELVTVEDAAMPSHPNRFAVRRELWAVRVPAVLTALMGLLNLWSTVTPSLPDRVQLMWDVLPFDVRRGSHLAAALAGFALITLSVNLWRRKQTAWALTIGALIISIFAHGLKGLDWEEASCALLLIVWLWRARRQFHARSDAPSVRQGLRVLIVAFVFTLLYGTVGFYLLDSQFKMDFGLGAAISQTVAMFSSFSDPGLEPITRFGQFFADSIYFIAASTFGYALLMLARPLVLRSDSSADLERARAIVEAHGRTALAFCALLGDKKFWFSPGGSFVQYALVGRVAVALGDPIGPPDDAATSLRGFVAMCERNDWRPAWYEIYDELLTEHRAAGLTILRIAHEAIIDVQNFNIAGGSNKNMRNAISALKKKGYKCEVHAAPQSDEFVARLRAVSDEWLAMMNGSEKSFSLGWFDDETIRNCPIMALHDPDGELLAFANIVPEYQLNESTIDLMRRREEIPRGTMEMLFVSLFEWSKEQGFDTFNLGPSPFAGVGEHSEDPATEKAIHFIYEHMNGFYNFKGLHAFKEKFHPSWRPLYLSYGGKGGLPVVAMAVVRADSGQDGWFDFLRGLRGAG